LQLQCYIYCFLRPNCRAAPFSLSFAASSDRPNLAGWPVLSRSEGRGPFWQARYYDFNVWSEVKRVEKLRYIHRNPVTRRLVERPEDWAWSSYRHYLTGEMGKVEIESHWTARKREALGVHPTVQLRDSDQNPPFASR
jgi:hypothetical protein